MLTCKTIIQCKQYIDNGYSPGGPRTPQQNHNYNNHHRQEKMKQWSDFLLKAANNLMFSVSDSNLNS